MQNFFSILVFRCGRLTRFGAGERWFHHTLVDADQAINPMMWQNAGKSGLDQWNFTMNAASAGKTQDPKGLSPVGFGQTTSHG